MMLYGAIEAGGTKFRSAVYENGKIIDELTVPTTTPNETLDKVITFFASYSLESLGIGAFGPIIIDQTNPDFGLITQTPKVKWRNFNVLQYIKERITIPIYLNTDAGVAALGEYWAYEGKVKNLIYITVGTGIGGAIITDGHIYAGAHHPELGHFLIMRKKNDYHPSVCPYHDNCLEGLASGSSLASRYQLSHSQMGEREDIWDLEGYYLAQAFFDYALAFSPDKIIIGGGVSAQKKLLPAVRKYFVRMNNNYFVYDQLKDPNTFIVTPLMGNNAGLFGAYCLARGDG